MGKVNHTKLQLLVHFFVPADGAAVEHLADDTVLVMNSQLQKESMAKMASYWRLV
jgi:hypothetical protein